MTAISVAAVVLDMDIYPRAEWSQATVNRYAEAINSGDEFPPIILEEESNRLLDGMHRLQAHKQALKDEIHVVWKAIPEGVPPKVFTASLSARHGDRVKHDELRVIARETIEANPDYDQKTLAQYFSVRRQTIGAWVGDIVEHQDNVRKTVALLLSRAKWSQTQIAGHLGIHQATVSRFMQDVNANILHNLTEDLLREASARIPESIDVEAIVEELRQERIFATWSEVERDLLKRLRSGETLVVSLRGDVHGNLIEWADAAGLYMRIDRRTDWGNPFETPSDGDRETVIANYAEHYLPYKPSLLAQVNELRGKALGCWCVPEPCHGHVIRWLAEADGDQAPILADELPAMLKAVRSTSASDFAAQAARNWNAEIER